MYWYYFIITFVSSLACSPDTAWSAGRVVVNIFTQNSHVWWTVVCGRVP